MSDRIGRYLFLTIGLLLGMAAVLAVARGCGS